MFWLIMNAFYVGLIVGFIGFLIAFLVAAIAHARVNRLQQALKDIDWDTVADLTLDVAKLKKAAQKWQNNENAQVKVTQKDLIEQAYLNHQLQQNKNVSVLGDNKYG